MGFFKKDKPSAPRQNWEAPLALRILYGIWKVLLTLVKIAAGAAATVLLIVVICGFVFVGLLGDYLQEDILPQSGMDMEGYDHEENSTLYYVDSDGQIQVYQQIYAEVSSKWASYEDIPEDLINAAIAIEDHRFHEHQGVDWITTVKATARMFFGDSSVGGSSITQQLIKNILLPEDDTADDVTVQRKVMEIFRAVQLEKRYNKETIMEMYLNVIYLGQNCKGVRSAAATYFGKEVEKLTLAECASLISITNNPSLFDPYNDEVFEYEGAMRNGKERNQYRQKLVLGQMLEYGFITQEEYDEAIAQKLVLKGGIDPQDRLSTCLNCGYKDTVSTFNTDGGNYYCPDCGTVVEVEKDESSYYYSWYTDTVLEDVAKAFAAQEGVAWNDTTKGLYMQKIQTGGYNIYTCIDMEVQNKLDAIYTNLDNIPETRGGQQLQSAAVIIDNRTGDIVAMVGGVGEKRGFDNWNMATDAERQSGSSIKPISIYAPGFESGQITPATVIPDLPISYGVVGSGAYPYNDTRTYSYSRTVFSGVTNSVNAVAARTLQKIGESYGYDYAKDNFGLSTLVENYVDADGETHSDIGIGPLAMGAQTWGVTVRDMSSAFATFANNGVYREGRTFTKVYDNEGNLVLDNEQDSNQILSEKSVNYMNYCLVNAVQDGTGYEADMSSSWSSLGITTAGKTGTTGDNKDRWFCGYTGYYTAAVWTGFEKPEVIKTVNGGNPAAQLWKKFMVPIHEGLSNKSLYDRDSMVSITVCLDSGKIATDACKNDIRSDSLNRLYSVRVYPEDVPREKCDQHVEMEYCADGKGVATDYCKKFAEVDKNVKITKVGLLKLTEQQIEDILQASRYGLVSGYVRDDYVYLVDKEGNDKNFTGMKNDANKDAEAPYIVCTKHTEKAWQEYENANPPETEPSEGNSEPTVPAPSISEGGN